ncbi:MAG: hypothetical protein WKG06_37440 [Segetibacter sp.]
MFISSEFLAVNYGVDDKIARFFVDREPPADNLYWKGKLLYLRPAPGYLFIPLIVDLLFKLGIDRQQLLSEEFVATMEQVGHISALEETRQISDNEAIKKCAELVKETCRNKDWLNDLVDYLNHRKVNFFSRLSSPFKALHRGDVFLFAVCSLEFPSELHEKIAEQWFALISTLLLLDDAEDIEADKETGDANAFLESGLNTEGIHKIKKLVSQNLEKIRVINPTMAFQLNMQYNENIEKPVLLSVKK